jgi:hypothetical protein
MGKFLKAPLILLLCTVLFNILIVASTLLLHEMGHFLTGVYVGCRDIKIVPISSELGTYTEMSCPHEQSVYFPLVGAFLLTLPYALSFLLLKNFSEKNFFWISLGFNFTISMVDISMIMQLQIFSFILGLFLIVFGEMLLIDKLLLSIEEV